MADKECIIQEFQNDEYSPSEVVEIKPLANHGKHYYQVRYKDDNGEHLTEVYVKEGHVLPLPK